MEFLTLFVSSFLVLVCIFNAFSRKSEKFSKYYLNRSLPLVKWTGIKLFQIDGYITLVQLRMGGVKVIEKLVSKYGRTFQLPVASVKTVATADPNIIQKMLSSVNPSHLNKPKSLYDVFLTDGMKDGILAADYEVWSPHRKAISRAFTYKSFQTYLNFMIEGAENLVKSACKSAIQNVEATVTNENMKAIIDHHVMKIITRVIMGTESYNLSNEEISEFQENFRRIKELSLGRFLHPEQMIPLIWNLHPNKRVLDSHLKEISKFAYKMTNNYRTHIRTAAKESLPSGNNLSDEERDSSGVKPFECMVEQMIKAGCNNQEIADEVNTILVAGHETILSSLDQLIFHLARNIEIQKKCQDEIDHFFSIYPTKEDLNMENISELKYLDRCILEGLRIAPTVPFFMRRLDTPLEIKENTFIEAGHSIAVLTWMVHRDPEIYPSPTVFDPERFTPENIKKRHPYAYIPFSLGARNCVGRKIALLEMNIIMAWILRHFEITTTDQMEDVKLLFDVTLKSERSYNVTFKQRDTQLNL